MPQGGLNMELRSLSALTRQRIWMRQSAQSGQVKRRIVLKILPFPASRLSV